MEQVGARWYAHRYAVDLDCCRRLQLRLERSATHGPKTFILYLNCCTSAFADPIYRRLRADRKYHSSHHHVAAFDDPAVQGTGDESVIWVGSRIAEFLDLACDFR